MTDRTLMDVVERMRNRFFGKYRGTVTAVDTQQVGRIKAKVPAVLGDVPTGWCMPCVPFAGDQQAMAFLPLEGAGVWIEFEGGDVSYPIWVGCYWHDGEVPRHVSPNVRVIKTKENQEIILDDDERTITIRDNSGNTITMKNDGIEIIRDGGKIKIADRDIVMNDGAMEVT